MSKLPKNIINNILNNHTSLGEHPSFPPDEEESFVLQTVCNFYDYLDKLVSEDKEENLSKEINDLLLLIKEKEKSNETNLEELVINYINSLFNIPENTLNIKCNIVNNIDNSSQRLLPEKTDDYSFDSINDMKYLTDEIYKRRMLNALITGASLYYSNDINSYVQDLFEINDELPHLYKKILLYNNKIIYLSNKDLSDNSSMEAGKVDVYLTQNQQPVEIISQGIIFPILLEETIKGILELAISHGLPHNKEKADYIIKKSDFRLAEIWDIRLGLPLWIKILKAIEDNGYDLKEVGINFFFMFLSEKEPYEFNFFLQEVFRKTKLGDKLICELLDNIIKNKEEDEFNDYINTQNLENTIEDGYFEEEELLSDSII